MLLLGGKLRLGGCRSFGLYQETKERVQDLFIGRIRSSQDSQLASPLDPRKESLLISIGSLPHLSGDVASGADGDDALVFPKSDLDFL
jgi:hypothetical protein